MGDLTGMLVFLWKMDFWVKSGWALSFLFNWFGCCVFKRHLTDCLQEFLMGQGVGVVMYLFGI